VFEIKFLLILKSLRDSIAIKIESIFWFAYDC